MIILNKASDVIIVDYPRLDWEKSLLKINRNFSILVLILSLNNLNFTQLFSQTMNKQNNNSTEVATFGAGCFWCAEAVFSRVEGVNDVQSGYSGGHVKNPSYKEVCTGNTGHAEVCQITYDSSKVSFLELLEIFWGTHNPTTLNRQGNDVGTQYRSVIFYYSPEQKKLATDMISRLDKEGIWDDPIVTEIVPFEAFYPAEEYHNDYYERNPNQAYCTFVITPKVEKFEKAFKDYLKKDIH